MYLKKVAMSGLILTSVILMTGCQKQIEGWGCLYYPSENVADGFETKEFSTKEEAFAWAEDKVTQAESESAHYMCGYNCSYNKGGEGGCVIDEGIM